MGQPSYSVDVSFRLFEGNRYIDCSAFEEDYKLLTDYDKGLTSKAYDGLYSVRESNGYCNFYSNVVHNDLVRKIVRGNDTMTLYFKNYRNTKYVIDTLDFKKGHYYLSENYIPKMDHDKAHRAYREVVLKETVIGSINNYELFYRCYECRSTTTDSIAVFCNKGKDRKKLLSAAFNDYYLEDVRLMKFKNHNFIYIRSGHTSGNSEGKLYALDDKGMEASEVIIERNIDIPDGYSAMKGFGLSPGEDDTFTTGYFLRSDDDGAGYEITTCYKLEKTGDNQYRLVPVKTEINRSY